MRFWFPVDPSTLLFERRSHMVTDCWIHQQYSYRMAIWSMNALVVTALCFLIAGHWVVLGKGILQYIGRPILCVIILPRYQHNCALGAHDRVCYLYQEPSNNSSLLPVYNLFWHFYPRPCRLETVAWHEQRYTTGLYKGAVPQWLDILRTCVSIGGSSLISFNQIDISMFNSRSVSVNAPVVVLSFLNPNPALDTIYAVFAAISSCVCFPPFSLERITRIDCCVHCIDIFPPCRPTYERLFTSNPWAIVSVFTIVAEFSFNGIIFRRITVSTVIWASNIHRGVVRNWHHFTWLSL